MMQRIYAHCRDNTFRSLSLSLSLSLSVNKSKKQITVSYKLEEWLENKLKMNVNKTKHVIIWNTKKELSRKMNISIKERRKLEKVTMMKYLGVVTDLSSIYYLRNIVIIY